MMTVGAATVRCQACGACHDVPICADPCPTDANTICLRVDAVDAVTLRLFTDAHRGPIVMAR